MSIGLRPMFHKVILWCLDAIGLCNVGRILRLLLNLASLLCRQGCRLRVVYCVLSILSHFLSIVV